MTSSSPWWTMGNRAPYSGSLLGISTRHPLALVDVQRPDNNHLQSDRREPEGPTR
jgi:hypothetical protein